MGQSVQQNKKCSYCFAVAAAAAAVVAVAVAAGSAFLPPVVELALVHSGSKVLHCYPSHAHA